VTGSAAISASMSAAVATAKPRIATAASAIPMATGRGLPNGEYNENDHEKQAENQGAAYVKDVHTFNIAHWGPRRDRPVNNLNIQTETLPNQRISTNTVTILLTLVAVFVTVAAATRISLMKDAFGR
jgi:hypothetical protein